MKNNALLRCAAWLLAVCAVMPMAVACGDDSENKPLQTTANKVESDTIDENDPYADRLAISDDLGEYDFDKYNFRIVCTDEGTIYVQEVESADVVDAAIFRRNRKIEERFNCEISVVMDAAGGGDVNGFVNKQITVGEDAFDLASMCVVALGGLVPNNLFLNWYDIPNVNFDKPWWSDSNKDVLTHSDVCFIAIGDLALSAMYSSYCMFYNKTIGSAYDMPDLFEIVNNGQWTIDKVIELSKDVYTDLNMDGKVDVESDMFGYMTHDGSSLNAYLWSFDNPIYKNVNGSLELTYKTEKLSSIFEKLVDTFKNYNGIKMASLDYVFAPHVFNEGRLMLVNAAISNALDYRDMDDDYSILPYPKWDEAQENYYTMADGSHHAMAVPMTIEDAEIVGTIVEALCAESYKTVFPAYYDVALKVKGARDEESIKMLDSIVASRIFDFGYVFDNWRGFAFLTQQQIARGNSNIESAYKRYEKTSLKWYNTVLEMFENYDVLN